MDYYVSADDGDRGRGLLSNAHGPSSSSTSNGKAALSDSVDLRASSTSSSSHSLPAFSPLSPSLQARLFPPTRLARALWLLAFLLILLATLLLGYEIGKRLVSSSSTSSPASSPHSRVLLISIDGFRASYLDDYNSSLPTLRAMRWNGVWAKRMLSCYPTVTFPNHWSIVTGLYTAQHGIVSNSMYDPVLNSSFNMQTLDARWWQGEPVWNTAMKQGRRANVLYWPGSEVEVQGMRPDVWYPYGNIPNPTRIQSMLGWLRNASCDLCVSYFSLVDDAGHSGGPSSPGVAAAVAVVDGLIAQLWQGLYEMGLQEQVTLLLVSDHGMSAIDTTQRVAVLDDYTDTSALRIIDSGATLGIWPTDLSQTEKIYADLAGGKVPHLTMLNESMAAALRYVGNRRIPPVIGVMDDGWVVATRARGYRGMGTHGYLPRTPSMGALFLAQGRGLKKGVVMEEVENVNVYALICHLLGITPAQTSGSLEVWKDVLA